VIAYLHAREMAHGSLDLDCIQVIEFDGQINSKVVVQVINHERFFIRALQNAASDSDDEQLPEFDPPALRRMQLADLHAIASITYFLLNGERVTASEFFHGSRKTSPSIRFISKLFSLTSEDLANPAALSDLLLDPWFTAERFRLSALVEHSLIKECINIYCDTKLQSLFDELVHFYAT